MKIAFHFNSEDKSLQHTLYHIPVLKDIFSILLSNRKLSISSKIFSGDLLFMSISSDITKSEDGFTHTFNKDKYLKNVDEWLHPSNSNWQSFDEDRLSDALLSTIYTVCFETIEIPLAEYLASKLKDLSPSYIGAIEVNDTSYVHWKLYSNSLIPNYRMVNTSLSFFWDGESEDSYDGLLKTTFKGLGFDAPFKLEKLHRQYGIFDLYENFEHANRVAEWKKKFGNFLSFTADDVVHRLSEAAPELGDRLWATLKTFEGAETNEQFAQVMASCRRLVEYVSDRLFPPLENDDGEFKLGSKNYRNRLLAFVDNERKSSTNLDLILVNTRVLGEQMEKLGNLANKGVHADVYRAETRRCLLRTIMLFDDIIALSPEPLRQRQ